MKKILIIILTISVLSSCDKKKQKNTSSDFEPKTKLNAVKNNKKQDTIYNYWELIHDTIADQKNFKISNRNYLIELKTYSLNDSLIVRNLGQGKSKAYLDHSHTMVTDFVLKSDSITDLKRIDRTDFKKSLIPEFYSECNLFSTEIDRIVGNKIYLTSDLNVPDTDNLWRVWYSIKITNGRLGSLEIKETDYVGL